MELLMERLDGQFRRDFIEGGVPGTLLPSIKELVARYGVSFAVAKRIYERLQADGVVRAEPRKGFFLEAPGRLRPLRASRRAVLIGLLGYVDHGHEHGAFCHCAQIHQALEHAANQHGWRLRFFNTYPLLAPAAAMLLEMAKARLDVVFVESAARMDASLADLRRLGVPLLTVDEPVTGTTCVSYDNVQIGLLATTHLLESGHRKVACVKFMPTRLWMTEREGGFREALARFGLPTAAGLVLQADKDDPEACRRCVRELRIRGVTGVFCVNDALALALLRAGLDTKESAVIGVDDSMEGRDCDLSTVHRSYGALGEAAFNVLLDHFDNGAPMPPQALLPGTLLKRGSTVSCAALV